MRVALDARLLAYQRAGIGNYVLGLLEGLRQIGQEGRLVVLISRKHDPADPALAGLRRRVLLTPPHHRWEQLALALELAPLAVDLYHQPDFIPPLRRRFPAVATVHDLAFLRLPGLLPPDSRRYYGQIGSAVRSAERTIAVSQCTRRDLIELVGAPPERIEVVYEAAGSDFRPQMAERIAAVGRDLGLPEEYFLFVGTREPRKNLARLLDAYARLAETPSAPDLAIVGSPGWLTDELASRTDALRIAGRVHWLVGVPRAELPALYAGAVGLVLPSLYEGFGLPVLEAMACGTPVVCADAGSLPEIAGGAARLFDPTDVGAIAEALGRVWREPALREELRARGRERAALFSWRRAAAETLDVYRHALR
ncbi:MAG TPA: glycosyltransferase family 1 protein [Chloroflexota bacterium]